jgi:hypothetical protein
MLECLIGCGNLLLKRRSLPFFRVKLVAEFIKRSFAGAFYFYVSNHLKLSPCEGDTRLVAPQDQVCEFFVRGGCVILWRLWILSVFIICE